MQFDVLGTSLQSLEFVFRLGQPKIALPHVLEDEPDLGLLKQTPGHPPPVTLVEDGQLLFDNPGEKDVLHTESHKGEDVASKPVSRDLNGISKG